MGYALLWIELLAMLLLGVGWLTAIAGRWKRAWLRFTFMVVVTLAPLVLLGGVTYSAGYAQFALGLHAGYFWPLLILAVLYAVGVTVMVIIGMRRRTVFEGEERRPSAADWSRQRWGISLLTACALFAMTWWNLDSAVKVQLSAIRAEAGTLALSAAPVRVPDHENAALVYARAFELDGPPDRRPAEWVDTWTEAVRKQSDFDFTDEKLAAFLQEKRPVLRLLREAAALESCDFEHDFARPDVGMRLEEVQQLRGAAWLLALDARHQAAVGNGRGAVDEVNAIYGISRHAGSDGLLVSLLVAIAIDAQASAVLEDLLNEGNLEADDVVRLDMGEWVSFRHDLERSFRMEEAFGLSVFASFDNANGLASCAMLLDADTAAPSMTESPLGGLAVSGYRVFLLPLEVDAYRKAMRSSRDFVSGPYPWSPEAKRRLEEQTKHANGLLVRLLLPALTATTDAAPRGDARRSLTRAAAAVYRYRAEHGEFPEQLDDLRPEYLSVVPLDPYDGNPIRYKHNEQEARLYSIGPDRTDDGGKEIEPPSDGKEGGDWVFRLSTERP